MNVPAHSAIAQALQVGVSHHQAGRFSEAEAVYRQVLHAEPIHADALHLLGLIATQAGQFEQAMNLISKAIEINPQAVYYDNLGSMFRNWGKLPAAVECHRQAIALQFNNYRAHNNLGNVLRDLGQAAFAADSFRMALMVNPGFAEAHNNLGNALRESGDLAAAEEHCRKAIALAPGFAEAHNNLGNALRDLNRLDEAVEQYRTALALNPDVAEMHINLGKVLRDQGNIRAAVESFRHALSIRPGGAEARSNLLFSLSFLTGSTPEEYLEEALRFGRQAEAQATPFTQWRMSAAPRPGEPLRIGFVTGELRAHPVGYFMESVLAHLDPSRVTPIAYTTRPDEDALTVRIKPRFVAWRSIAGLDDGAAARVIHGDGVHILVDLAGHTNRNRLPVFAWKPAPVQASWLGYFASTGLPAIDYVLGDAHVLPAGEASHFVERPWRLPDGYLCFTPPQPEVKIGALPMLSNDRVTFGCFNDLMKMNDAVVAVWSRVLHAVPGSQLFLKASQLNDASARRTTLERFVAHAIDASRLVLEGPSPRHEYLAAYNRVDITLSPFPYAGGTTTAEGLWMGVPVLCRRGDRFLPHLCESVLHSAGLGDWIAAGDDDYVAKAVSFASGRQRLAALRDGLRAQILSSPLCDAPGHARKLERAFAEMWQMHCAQHAPA